MSNKIVWTEEDSKAARRRSWDIFTRSNDKKLPYDLERLDHHTRYANDDEAVEGVIRRAKKGDALCQKAIAFLHQEVGHTEYYQLTFAPHYVVR